VVHRRREIIDCRVRNGDENQEMTMKHYYDSV
jgi:hypothetical protein